MALQLRDQPLLEYLARYYLLAPSHIQQLCYPESTSRVTRRRCASLAADGYIHRYPKKHDDNRRPVYYLADRGKEWLADHYDDDRYLAKPTKLLCRSEHVEHTLAVGEFLHSLQQAISRQDVVELCESFHEFEPVNPTAEAADWIRLFTEIRPSPRLVCMPDAAFMLGRDEHRVIYYVERETGTSGSSVVPKKKYGGYQELDRRELFRKHFPQTTWKHFFVLVVCPTPRWRDRFVKHLVKVAGDDAQRWKAISVEDTAPERLLFEPVVRQSNQNDLVPLIPA
ncbi:MAG: replication-relaxation family protein [Pirellulales bacterium]|nr:replication-relaxation family protein [Pirellulales bacterium]